MQMDFSKATQDAFATISNINPDSIAVNQSSQMLLDIIVNQKGYFEYLISAYHETSNISYRTFIYSMMLRVLDYFSDDNFFDHCVAPYEEICSKLLDLFKTEDTLIYDQISNVLIQAIPKLNWFHFLSDAFPLIKSSVQIAERLLRVITSIEFFTIFQDSLVIEQYQSYIISLITDYISSKEPSKFLDSLASSCFSLLPISGLNPDQGLIIFQVIKNIFSYKSPIFIKTIEAINGFLRNLSSSLVFDQFQTFIQEINDIAIKRLGEASSEPLPDGESPVFTQDSPELMTDFQFSTLCETIIFTPFDNEDKEKIAYIFQNIIIPNIDYHQGEIELFKSDPYEFYRHDTDFDSHSYRRQAAISLYLSFQGYENFISVCSEIMYELLSTPEKVPLPLFSLIDSQFYENHTEQVHSLIISGLQSDNPITQTSALFMLSTPIFHKIAIEQLPKIISFLDSPLPYPLYVAEIFRALLSNHEILDQIPKLISLSDLLQKFLSVVDENNNPYPIILSAVILIVIRFGDKNLSSSITDRLLNLLISVFKCETIVTSQIRHDLFNCLSLTLTLEIPYQVCTFIIDSLYNFPQQAPNLLQISSHVLMKIQSMVTVEKSDVYDTYYVTKIEEITNYLQQHPEYNETIRNLVNIISSPNIWCHPSNLYPLLKLFKQILKTAPQAILEKYSNFLTLLGFLIPKRESPAAVNLIMSIISYLPYFADPVMITEPIFKIILSELKQYPELSLSFPTQAILFKIMSVVGLEPVISQLNDEIVSNICTIEYLDASFIQTALDLIFIIEKPKNLISKIMFYVIKPDNAHLLFKCQLQVSPIDKRKSEYETFSYLPLNATQSIPHYLPSMFLNKTGQIIKQWANEHPKDFESIAPSIDLYKFQKNTNVDFGIEAPPSFSTISCNVI